MNNTTKAKHDLAARMLKVNISIDEIALMSGLTVDEIQRIKANLKPEDCMDNATFATQNMMSKQ